MLNLNNTEIVKKAYEYVRNVVGDFFDSSVYSNAKQRYENRINAYYCRLDKSQAAWRSKLHMPTFFLGCKALDAQFKEMHKAENWLFVKPMDDSIHNPEAKQLADIAHYDLMYDLKISDFIEKKTQLDWYVEVFGTAVGREYIRTEQITKTKKRPNINAYGYNLGIIEDVEIERKEYTKTQVIHPLNFAHDVTKQNFKTSQWGAVRFELPISDLYAFKGHGNYYQPGVKEVIEKVRREDFDGYTANSYDIYIERSQDLRRNVIPVVEYSGPIKIQGNEIDNTRYYVLYCPLWEKILRITKSPFNRHPYWKVQTYPDPDGPYGVGPNDMLRPLNLWENSTVNQYVDYMNSALKFMYKFSPGDVMGGVDAVVNSLPHGVMMIEKGGDFNRAIDVINKNAGSIPPVGDVLTLIEKLKQEVGPSSNLRGKSNNQLADTATGISLQAQREDVMTAAIQDGIDSGIQDGMSLKLWNYMNFFTEPRAAIIGEQKDTLINHYPFELYNGGEFSFQVVRRLADIEAGKHVNFIRMLTGLDNLLMAKGQSLPVEFLIDAYEETGKALGIIDIKEKFNKLRENISINTNSMQQPGAPGMGPVGQVSTNPNDLTMPNIEGDASEMAMGIG